MCQVLIEDFLRERASKHVSQRHGQTQRTRACQNTSMDNSKIRVHTYGGGAEIFD